MRAHGIIKIFYDDSDTEFILKNIYYFNGSKNILLLVNISKIIYGNIKNVEILKQKYKCLFFICENLDTRHNIKMIVPLQKSIEYILENKMVSKYVIFSTDSEIFIKTIDIKTIDIKNVYLHERSTPHPHISYNYDNINQLKTYLKNTNWDQTKAIASHDSLLEYLHSNKIQIVGNDYTGLIFEFIGCEKIINHLTVICDNYLDTSLKYALDEIIFSSLLTHYNISYANICHTYWDSNDHYNDMINIINNENYTHILEYTSLKRKSTSMIEYINKIIK